MTYQSVAEISQLVAMFLFIALFVGVLVYVFWPGNRSRFERAARAPLDQDPDLEENGRS